MLPDRLLGHIYDQTSSSLSAGWIVMADIYTSEINAFSRQRWSAREDRLSLGGAAFAVLGLSLLLWMPLLLPIVMLLRG
jgi:hypothetical protein